MTTATTGMNNTAQNMKTVTGVLNNLTKFLGYGRQVISALQNASGVAGATPTQSTAATFRSTTSS